MGWRVRFKAVLLCWAMLCVAPGAAICANQVGPQIPTTDDAPQNVEVKTVQADAPSTGEDAAEHRSLGPVRKPAARAATTVARDADAAARAGTASQAMTTVGALILVVALILAAASVFRRLARQHGSLAGGFSAGGRSPAGLLSVLGRYPIAGGQTLVLLKVDRRVLLLSQTRSGRFGASVNLSTLCEITEAEDVASILTKANDEDGRSLAKTFERVLRDSEKQTDRALARAAAPAPVVDVRRSSSAQRAAATNERATRQRSASIPAADVVAPASRPIEPRKNPSPTGAESVEAIRRRLNAMRGEQPKASRSVGAFA
jgi:flagellar biogenesis protein FliO